MGNSESGNATTNTEHGQLAVALNRLDQGIGDSLAGIEASFSRLADTLETTLQRLETKLNAVRKTLKLLPDHLKEKGNAAGRAVAKGGKLGLIPFGEEIGEWINLIPSDPEDLKQFKRFYNEDSNKLRERFGTHERDITAYRSDPDTVTAQEDIANSYHEQKLILTALIEKARKYKLGLDEIRKSRAVAGGLDLSENLQENLISLNRIKKELRTIRDIATSPKLQKLINGTLPILLSPEPFFGEVGEEQAGGRIMPLSHIGGFGDDAQFGGAGSDTLRDTLRELGVTIEDTEGSVTGLTEAVKGFTAQGGSLTALVEGINGGLDLQTSLLGILRKEVPELGESLTGLFERNTEGAESLNQAVAAVGESFLDAFEGAIVRGESLSDVLKGLGRDLAKLALKEIETGGLTGLLGKVTGFFGGGTAAAATTSAATTAGLGPQFTGTGLEGLLASGSFAKGGAFANGRSLTALARGGALTNAIVDRPTLFPMADGAGLMGEAGPEAVLPLTRLANGDLGVKSLPGAGAGGFAGNRTVNISIDARGADRGAIHDLRRTVNELAQAINHDRANFRNNVLGTVMEARSRGGNIARAFGGW